MKTTLKFGRCKTQIRDAATDKVIKESGWTKNLVFDTGLIALANYIGGSGGFPYLFKSAKSAPARVRTPLRPAR